MQIDIVSGITAGIAANLISHPLDTLKVRMQLAEAKDIKIWPTIRDIYKYEGVNTS